MFSVSLSVYLGPGMCIGFGVCGVFVQSKCGDISDQNETDVHETIIIVWSIQHLNYRYSSVIIR